MAYQGSMPPTSEASQSKSCSNWKTTGCRWRTTRMLSKASSRLISCMLCLRESSPRTNSSASCAGIPHRTKHLRSASKTCTFEYRHREWSGCGDGRGRESKNIVHRCIRVPRREVASGQCARTARGCGESLMTDSECPSALCPDTRGSVREALSLCFVSAGILRNFDLPQVH